MRRLGLPDIVIPRLHWAYIGERVNVQDYIGGVPGSQLAQLTPEAGFDRPLLARRGAQAVLKMIVEDGFFHADPHPGNVFDLPGNRLTMALVIAALIIGSSIVMTVKGGPTLLGLPVFGFLGFMGAVLGGLWLVRTMWRSSRGSEADDTD